MQAASELFLQNGFSHTSVDSVAKLANVSKQTVYSHYQNKDGLFKAVIELKVEEYQIDSHSKQDYRHDLKGWLTNIAHQFIELLNDPDVIAMYKVVISEATKNPHVAELFYQAGPKHTRNLMACGLRQAAGGSLSEVDAEFCATSFFNLLQGEYHIQRLLGLSIKQSKADIILFIQRVITGYMPLLMAQPCQWLADSSEHQPVG